MYLDDLDEDEYEIAIKVSDASASRQRQPLPPPEAMQQLFCPKFGLTGFFRVWWALTAPSLRRSVCLSAPLPFPSL